jgi:inner membrane protein
MDPVTHALASVALARAGIEKTSRMALPMLLVSGLIADVDWITRMGSPSLFLNGYRTATHSIAGTGFLILIVSAAFWYRGKINPRGAVSFRNAVIICTIGAGAHLLLDLLNDYGVKLWWPVSTRWYAWDLAAMVDWWIIFFLLAGLFLPWLFALIHEEIGSRPRQRGRQRGAIAGIFMVLCFIAGRGMAHERALAILNSRVYHAQTPLRVAAFPESTTPLAWSGVIETDNAISTIDVSLFPGAPFDADQARVHFKPEDSAVLSSAAQSRSAKLFLNFARFPLASIGSQEGVTQVSLRDLRFAPGAARWQNVIAVIKLNDQNAVTDEHLEFNSAAGN